ncbi:MAG: anion permease, partial [Anaerolineales bacterium]|nr:anion permease [Anaerolineales bacterium]
IVQIRHDDQVLEPAVEYKIKAGDVLVVQGAFQDILAASKAHKLSALSTSQEPNKAFDVHQGELELAEISLARRSRREGQTLREMEFRSRYNLNVIAIRHNGQDMASHLGEIPLSLGDVLLVQGQKEQFKLLRENPNFEVLDIAPRETKRTDKAGLTVGLFAVGLLIITAGWLDVATTLVTIAAIMVILGILTMDEAYRSIDWQSIFLIAGLLPLGIAMEQTGTAALLAHNLISTIGNAGPLAIMAGLFLMTTLLTSIISNAAATVLMVPIAIDAALGVGVNPQPFVLATVIAASCAFLLPVGHQVNIVIFGPGGYKFYDYPRVGFGLTLLVFLIVMVVLPLFWPLY